MSTAHSGLYWLKPFVKNIHQPLDLLTPYTCILCLPKGNWICPFWQIDLCCLLFVATIKRTDLFSLLWRQNARIRFQFLFNKRTWVRSKKTFLMNYIWPPLRSGVSFMVEMMLSVLLLMMLSAKTDLDQDDPNPLPEIERRWRRCRRKRGRRKAPTLTTFWLIIYKLEKRRRCLFFETNLSETNKIKRRSYTNFC